MPLILVPPYRKLGAALIALLYGSTIRTPSIYGYSENLNQSQGGLSTMHSIIITVRIVKATGKITAEVDRNTSGGQWVSSISGEIRRNSIFLANNSNSQGGVASMTVDAVAGNYEVSSTSHQPIHLRFTMSSDGTLSNLECVRDAYQTYNGVTKYGASILTSQLVVS